MKVLTCISIENSYTHIDNIERFEKVLYTNFMCGKFLDKAAQLFKAYLYLLVHSSLSAFIFIFIVKRNLVFRK